MLAELINRTVVASRFQRWLHIFFYMLFMPNPIVLFETAEPGGGFRKKKKSCDSCAKCGDEIFHLPKFFSATAIIIRLDILDV